jgi:hypothetical protein
MEKDKVKREEIPEEFSSYEEAGEFWDSHDSTDYLDQMTPVSMDARLEARRFEIEVDEDIVMQLRQRAVLESLSASRLANRLLRKELAAQ